jgi:hypothetical protein
MFNPKRVNLWRRKRPRIKGLPTRRAPYNASFISNVHSIGLLAQVRRALGGLADEHTILMRTGCKRLNMPIRTWGFHPRVGFIEKPLRVST